MFCGNCGAIINGDEKYCPFCGASVVPDNNQQPADSSYDSQNQQMYQQEYGQQIQSGYDQSYGQQIPYGYDQSYGQQMQSGYNQSYDQQGYQQSSNQSQQSGMQNKKKKKSKIKIFFVVLLCVIIAGGSLFGVLYYKWYTSPEQELIRALKNEDYNRAVSIYNGDYDGDDKTIKKALEDRIETIRQNFKNGKMEYSVALDELGTICTMNVSGIYDKASEAIGYVNKLNESKKAYNSAKELYAKKDYYEALKKYKKVIKEDNNYEDAQKKLNECVSEYRKAVLKDASDLAESGSYKDAINKLNQALDTLPDDSEIEPRMDEYKKSYIDSVISAADEQAAAGNYNDAISKLNEALKVVGSDETLQAKLNEIQGNKPVSLASLTAINGGWNWNTGTPTDPFGNTYSTASNFAIFNDSIGDSQYIDQVSIPNYGNWVSIYESYAEYRLYGDYKQLSFDIVPNESIGEYLYGSVKVYADDTLVFSSPNIGRKTDLQSYQVDVTGAEYIKIVVDTTEDGDAIMLLNCTLTK